MLAGGADASRCAQAIMAAYGIRLWAAAVEPLVAALRLFATEADHWQISVQEVMREFQAMIAERSSLKTSLSMCMLLCQASR